MQLQNLNTKFLGKNSIYYEQIDSTQDEIWRKIKNKTIKNGTLIIADIQTSGKGTHGRTWYTDESNNIAFSLFAEMNCDVKALTGITLKIAKIILDIFYTNYGIKLEIKEPNDIVIKNKKLGGILTQTSLEGEKVKYLVVGIGINTNKENFSEDIKDIATSIKKEFNVEVDREVFIAEFCNILEKELIKRIGGN